MASVTNDAPAVFLIGATTVTWTVTDNAGLTATCTQTVTVSDNVPPTITCPVDAQHQQVVPSRRTTAVWLP
ncbi:MAG: HYR domain-containing protein [Flavobacteriales bacterium]|nr:HYR domain-containing protein [Flavobacteriales bacterium]